MLRGVKPREPCSSVTPLYSDYGNLGSAVSPLWLVPIIAYSHIRISRWVFYKLIRQYIPKGINFRELTDGFVKEIQYKINRRSRGGNRLPHSLKEFSNISSDFSLDFAMEKDDPCQEKRFYWKRYSRKIPFSWVFQNIFCTFVPVVFLSVRGR